MKQYEMRQGKININHETSRKKIHKMHAKIAVVKILQNYEWFEKIIFNLTSFFHLDNLKYP